MDSVQDIEEGKEKVSKGEQALQWLESLDEVVQGLNKKTELILDEFKTLKAHMLGMDRIMKTFSRGFTDLKDIKKTIDELNQGSQE